ncbi:CCAAT/enhancer-binding protein zeta [Phoenix dactylifera]|uniref:CCAAT/enhancer-binding protein zeta n=1 Tax=Phoenix dactylifera TaxID=42345 RepID=A0A8B9AXJ5_PHODC|nr:CCAAT/enhancer-binding protein zeta [Phoenix dactylifera]
MAMSKPKKPHQIPEDLELLKSDVASFVSSLGLAPSSGASGAGFDDSDFRKTGSFKPPKSRDPKPSAPEKIDGGEKKNKKDDSDSKPKPKPKPHPLQIDPFENAKYDKNLPMLPLMKASLLSGYWYNDADDLEGKVLGPEGRKKVPSLGIEELKRLVSKKKEVAERLLRQYTLDYDSSRRKSGDMRLLEVTARSGTSADKVSAFTCLVEDNPIANMRSLDALLSMVTSRVGKRYAFTGFEALKELFLLRLLPDRKLKSLFQHPLDNLPETKDGFSLLLFWYWEECLKQRYERFVIALEEALKDMLPNLKDKAMKTVYTLLKSKSEQERRLLTALVNKLGDPERKAASSAAYHLSCLLSAHPNMKAVVIDEVDSFIFRPHIGLRAKYQAVNFLSQILLSKKGDGPKIAKRLVDVYFALFKVLISEANDGEKMCKKAKNNRKSVDGEEKSKKVKGKMTSSLQNGKKEPSLGSNVEMDSRLLSAVLTGVNRAFPFVSSDEADDIVEVQTPVLFRLVHSGNFNIGVQALMLLYQITSKNQIASDRFYRALYSKLLTPAAVTSSKPEMFLGLLVKAMKNDINLKRVAAFSKRLMQAALQRPPQYACGCLFILSEVLKAKPPLWTVVLQNESVDDDLEHFEDIIEGTEDLSMTPSGNSANSGCSSASQAGKKLQNSNYKEDYDSEVDDGSRIKTVSDGSKEEVQPSHMRSKLPAGYDPRHREPSYCNADHASWWELTILAAHVHPSVATMARTILSGANIVYNGDPLNDLSLGAFLDKFMEKKPKPNRRAEGTWHGGSQIAPARKLDLNHHLIGDEILQLAEDEVPPEDVVFHRFYMNKTSSSKKPKAKKKASQDDEDAEDFLDASDESEEEEIDNMLGSGHRPLEEADGEYDYDDLDRVADEEDDDLLGDGSDAEAGSPPDLAARKHDEGSASDDEDDDDDSLDIMDSIAEEGGDVDVDDAVIGGGSDEEESSQAAKTEKGKKRKFNRTNRASPFANLEEYEHLMNDNMDTTKISRPHKRKKKTSN